MPRFDHRTTSPASQEADLLLLPVFEGPEAGPGVREVGRALGADLEQVLKDNGVKGRLGDTLTIPTLGGIPAGTVLLVGVGPKAEATPERIRRAAGRAGARATRYRRVASTLPQATKGSWELGVGAFVEGLLLGGYRFDRYKADNGEGPKLKQVTILAAPRWEKKAVGAAIRRAEVLAESVRWVRDLVNSPAIEATPEYLAKEARAMAREVGLEVKIWTKAQLEKGGFGGILGVGRGSVNPPVLIELVYKGGSGAPVALTGKGVTFDSGGLSIKDAKGMEAMKEDMAGAATMLGVMRAIALLKPKINVIAAIPSAENMPSGSAIRPGDVLRHRGGVTSEVLNTDAEGRLILADALALLAEKKPRLIVDAATLTGAMMVALGTDLWGVMGNDRDVVRDLLDAGEEAGEPGWELPLWEPYAKLIDSQVADVKNTGGRWGGAITAGLFLKRFVGDVPWAHVDIAGTAFAERPGDLWPRGATGNPLRAFVAFVEKQAQRARARKPARAARR